MDSFPALFRTTIPGVVDYPISNADKAWGFVHGLIYFAFGLSLRDSFGGLAEVISNLGKRRYREPKEK